MPASSLLELDRKVAGLEALRDERQRQLKAVEDELTNLIKETDLLSKADLVLGTIAQRILGQSTKVVDQLVSAGLKAVFDNQNLEFKATTEKFRGKTAVKLDLYEDGRPAPLMESYGGGVIAMIGVLLRITAILVLNLRRVLVLDETLSHLSEEYHANASSLLKKLAKELGFTILMVTHAPTLALSADRHYVAKKTKLGTTFTDESTKEPVPA